jgi:imidazoleglycerol-phosphate dehydratase
MRTIERERITKETKINVSLDLDGSGESEVKTPITFLSHMLTSLSFHSLIDMKLSAEGDLNHHVVEDSALCLGEAIRNAVLKGPAIRRFGFANVPMDCSLATCSVDLGGRPAAVIELGLINEYVEDMASQDIEHFLRSLSIGLNANIHAHVEYGENDHHKAESVFKALALSFRSALELDERRNEVPSSKGVI